jgi:ABC-type multidrug transport system ATPase subunit
LIRVLASPTRRRRDVLGDGRLRKHTTVFCTHPERCARVSDNVAILNRGQLVTQAPIEELLAGTGETVYTVTLKGDVEKAYQRTQAQPWVSGLETSRSGDQMIWHVSVTDAAAAQDQLLSLILASGGVTVSDFGRKELDLEEVFLNIVGGSGA